MSKTQPKLIIIDGNALIHRSFHALPPTLRTKQGQLVNAVYGFSSFLLKALQEFQPDYAVLTLDKSGPTFRHETYNDYKATRTKAPDELYEQIPLVKKVAQAFGLPIFELSGYEADDLIGSICAKNSHLKKLQTIIITGDLDTLQLIDDQTKVYTMSRGLSDSVLYGPEEVMNRYGLRPDQLLDFRALRGDPSDNIPGVRGIGEKNAGELVRIFGNLDQIYQALKKADSRLKPRLAELLARDREQAYLSRQLSEINKNAPIKFSLPDTAWQSFSLTAVFQVFQELEFKSLLPKAKELRDRLNNSDKKIKNTGAQTPDQDNSATTVLRPTAKKIEKLNYQLVDTPQKLTAVLKKITQTRAVALSLAVRGDNPLTAKLLGLGLSWQATQACFIPARQDNLPALAELLAQEKIKKIGHDLKFTWRVLNHHNLKLQGQYFDVMIASYLLNPSSRQHDLSSLAFTELGWDIKNNQKTDDQPTQARLDLNEPDFQALANQHCEQADLIGRLAETFQPKIRAAGLTMVCEQIEMPLIPVLAAMEQVGLKINLNRLQRLEKDTAAKISRLEKNIWRLAGQKFNINSTKQLKEVLFVNLAIPTDNIKKTKTGFSTAEEELNKLQNQHPIISELQEFRELSKLQNTYLQALPKMIDPTSGRIHSNFNQTVAATGRLSSSEPNLQNIPVKTEEGQKVRSAFETEAGWRLVAFDYSQIELRLTAHMSKDKKMIAAFKAGQDIHAATAAAINDLPLAKVSAQMRREAKAVNFGIIYGQGPHGLSQGAGLPYFAAQEFIKKYFQTYPAIKIMMDKFITQARELGYVQTLFQRRRWLPEINSQLPAVRKAAERMAINAPIQGTAADIIKLAMVKVAQLIAPQEHEIRLLLQVHDELIFEIARDKVEKYAPIIKQAMEQAAQLSVPLVVDLKSGSNWAKLK